MNSQYNLDRGVGSATVKGDERDVNRCLGKVRVTKGKLMETVPPDLCSQLVC